MFKCETEGFAEAQVWVPSSTGHGPAVWSVSAGRPRAARPRPEGGPSRSPSPSRRCRSAARSTPTTRRTPTSSASTPTTSSTSSRKILLAGGQEDYEGNKVCFPTIMSPKYKRLSREKLAWRYQWLEMFSLAFRTLFFQDLSFPEVSSPVNCVWAGRVTTVQTLIFVSAPYSNELTNYLLYLKPGLNTW